jgi:serpin B
MKSDKLQNAIGGIDPDLIARSEFPVKKKRGYKITSVIAAMLALAIGMGIFWGNPGYSGYTVYAGDMIAVYPTMIPYAAYSVDPDGHEAWWADQEKRLDYFGEAENMQSFIQATAAELLSGDGKNIVYSPLNMYIALAMLAETTDGNTRKQLLNLLDANNIQTLRKRANALWNANYNDDGLTSSILASSLWLNEKCSFYKETLEILRDSYYASSYQGEMGSESFEKALHAWLNDQTGGLLSDQINEITFSPETILALATTVYFQASWQDKFHEEATEKNVFHSVSGDTEADFMHQNYSGDYCRGEKFSAVSKSLEEGEKMWFILPDEGISVNDLLRDDEVLSFIGNTYAWSDQQETAIQLAVPKFTVSSKLDLKEPLENLGVTDCFEAYRADFSPLLAEKAFVGKIEHGAFVGIDEEGVTAAAYTFTQMYGTGPSKNTVNFTVDRPFLFVITGVDGSAMFIGVVNQL